MTMLRKLDGSFVVPAADAEGRQLVYTFTPPPPVKLGSAAVLVGAAPLTLEFPNATITRVRVINDGAASYDDQALGADANLSFSYGTPDEVLILPDEYVDEEVSAERLVLRCTENARVWVRYAVYGYEVG